MAKSDIIQELNDLESSLAAASSENAYSVPNGYFEGFAEKMLNLVKEEDDQTFLSLLPKNNPYQVPADYFDELELKILSTVRNHPDYLRDESFGQTSREELESISPLLNSLNKEPV